MSPERFAQILQAYGASPARWPQAERAAAGALLMAADAADGVGAAFGAGGAGEADGADDIDGAEDGNRRAAALHAQAMLAAAEALDSELDAHSVEEPDDALIRQVLESMPIAMPIAMPARSATRPDVPDVPRTLSDPEAVWAPAGVSDPSMPAHPTRAGMPSKPSKPTRPFAWRQPRLWFSGVGLLGAGAVGVAAGALMMSLLTPTFSTPSSEPAAVEQTYGGTVFSDAATEGDDR